MLSGIKMMQKWGYLCSLCKTCLTCALPFLQLVSVGFGTTIPISPYIFEKVFLCILVQIYRDTGSVLSVITTNERIEYCTDILEICCSTS